MDDLRDAAWDTADKLVDAGCMCRAECIDKHTNAIASAIRAAVAAEREARAQIADQAAPAGRDHAQVLYDGELETEIIRLRAENERLRATLTIMAEASTDAINRPLRELARAALDERHPQEDR